MKLLEGKVAIITGGTRGIGNAIVKLFAQHGAIVIFTFINSTELAKNIEKKFSYYSIIKGYKVDAVDLQASQEFSNKIYKEFGKIDILINNTGIIKDNLLLRMSKEDWDKVIETNLNSVFNFTKSVIIPMIKQRNGSIINMSSIIGINGNVGQANYAASKAGIIGFTKSIAKELGSRNIRCNAIAPGFINTEMNALLDDKKNYMNYISLKKIGNPIDVANCCLFLASDLSAYVTGEVLNVNGGMYY
ncbi:MAG: 3-oxoacyl-[acyl-carrier-protein] reductase [Candidatus Bostrichicola ureolyticus]|nr:MAG: 3-oxoacyl-[acyl-carrier-protein] reductase [Candidatus Bostrichicola ureolyticus]